MVFLWAGSIYLVPTSTVAGLLGFVERRTYVVGVANV